MRCPKCGYVSYPGLSQCKKCGRSFDPTKHKEASPPVQSLFSGSLPRPPGQSIAPPPPEEPSPASSAPSVAFPVKAVEREPSLPVLSPVPAVEQAPPTGPARPWREELSDRVEDFRRRRAHLRGDLDPGANLEFDFKGEEHAPSAAKVEADVIELPSRETSFDIELERQARRPAEVPPLDSVPLDDREAEQRIQDAAAVEAGETPLAPMTVQPEPVEIVMDSPPLAETAEAEARPSALPMAPIGRRFLAGMLDALVLLVAGGLFALIFWRTGGRLSIQPLNFCVVGFIAAFLIMAYFGLFTALTSTTPGLLWLGIEVRSLDGTFPLPTQAFWRAFGYLVSTGALMLGFVWALVDSDGLTWHDRMSGTFLGVAEAAIENQKSTVES